MLMSEMLTNENTCIDLITVKCILIFFVKVVNIAFVEHSSAAEYQQYDNRDHLPSFVHISVEE